MTPKRIQRRRMKGWRMPEGAVYVGRPTKWGNPYIIDPYALKIGVNEFSLDLYRMTARGIWDPSIIPERLLSEAETIYSAHLAFLRRLGGGHPIERIRRELRGKDLACWCRLSAPCHADILLDIANAEPTP